MSTSLGELIKRTLLMSYFSNLNKFQAVRTAIDILPQNVALGIPDNISKRRGENITEKTDDRTLVCRSRRRNCSTQGEKTGKKIQLLQTEETSKNDTLL